MHYNASLISCITEDVLSKALKSTTFLITPIDDLTLGIPRGTLNIRINLTLAETIRRWFYCSDRVLQVSERLSPNHLIAIWLNNTHYNTKPIQYSELQWRAASTIQYRLLKLTKATLKRMSHWSWLLVGV